MFCSFGHEKTGLRKEVNAFMRKLRDDQDTKLKVVVKAGMSAEEYHDTLVRSKIVVDAWGGGDTTDRFWEGVGAGACVLYQRYNVVMPHPFIDFEHAVSFSSISELSNCLHRLVYSTEAKGIGERGLAHALHYHTARHRAEEILNHVFTR